jgi:DNA repair protein RecO (recombination protein O)
MNTITANAIILSRRDYGEADRILVVLTDTEGVIHIVAKGVRKIKSKLAGGIELFAINELTVAAGKGELKTLVSSRMKSAYEFILTDITRTMLGYEFLRFLYKHLEHEAGEEYFMLLRGALEGLNSSSVHPQLVSLWFYMQFLALGGMQPDLTHDTLGQKLSADSRYAYNPDEGRLQPSANGILGADHIKIARLLLSQPLTTAARIKVDPSVLDSCAVFIQQVKHQ